MTPVAGPFRAADGSAVRPLQKGDHAWMCHFDSVYETLKEDVHFAALEAAVGRATPARVPALVARVLGSDGGDRFDASCARPGDALRPALYRFNGVEPERGRTCALALNESLQSQYARAPAANVLYEGPRVLVKSKCGTAKRYLQPEEARRKCELKAARRRARGQAAARRRDGGAARGGAHRQVREALQAAGEENDDGAGAGRVLPARAPVAGQEQHELLRRRGRRRGRHRKQATRARGSSSARRRAARRTRPRSPR